MTIVQRRIFYGKVGSAGELVTWAHDMYEVLRVHSPEIPFRVLSDYQSGRTDRVVVEIEIESMAHLDATLEKTMADPDTQVRFESVFGRLKNLIDHAEVEQWTIS